MAAPAACVTVAIRAVPGAALADVKKPTAWTRPREPSTAMSQTLPANWGSQVGSSWPVAARSRTAFQIQCCDPARTM